MTIGLTTKSQLICCLCYIDHRSYLCVRCKYLAWKYFCRMSCHNALVQPILFILISFKYNLTYWYSRCFYRPGICRISLFFYTNFSLLELLKSYIEPLLHRRCKLHNIFIEFCRWIVKKNEIPFLIIYYFVYFRNYFFTLFIYT